MEWKYLTPMLSKRAYFTFAEYSGSLYTIGGCDPNGSPVDCFESFNYSKKKWFGHPCLPTKRASSAAVVVGNNIVVLGGVEVGQKASSAVEVYDLIEKDWKVCDGLKEGLAGLSCVVKDNKIITIGGSATDTNPRDHCMVYDVDANSWKAINNMPTARYGASSFVVGDKIYVIGGRQGKLPTSSLEVLDLNTGKWQTLPQIPSKRIFISFLCDGSYIYSIGGMDVKGGANKMTDTVEIFDMRSEIWSKGSSMKTKRADMAAGLINGKLYVLCGLGREGRAIGTAECFDPSMKGWSTLSDLPFSVCGPTFYCSEHGMYIGGGVSEQGLTNNFGVFAKKN